MMHACAYLTWVYQFKSRDKNIFAEQRQKYNVGLKFMYAKV